MLVAQDSMEAAAPGRKRQYVTHWVHSRKQREGSKTWGLTALTPTLGKLRQEDCPPVKQFGLPM